MNQEVLSSLANHLWQSTLFAAIAGLLTLTLQNNRARVRHGIWLAASCKFLVPISLLIALGGQIHWRSAPDTTSRAMREVVQPFAMPPASSPATATAPAATHPLPEILLGIWACGFLAIGCSWLIRWRRMKAVVRTGTPVQMEIPLRALSCRTTLEPGVFGIFRPVLLLPEGISDQLSRAQLQAVIAHELCHVRNRDNLVAALHMCIETVFWFHPLVWWIGKRMVAERERACDEEVVWLGSEPRIYAEGILNVCRSCLSSPLPCASGVTASNLNRRIEAILTNQPTRSLNASKKLLLIAAGAAALSAPIAIGTSAALPAQSQPRPETPTPAFEAASVKLHQDTGGRERTRTIEPARISCLNITLRELILMGFSVKPWQIQEPDWIQNTTYDVIATAGKSVGVEQIKRMLQPLLVERFHLVVHREPRQMSVFALTLAKGGPKFKSGEGGELTFTMEAAGDLSFGNYSMNDFADWLSSPSLDRPVVDRTGLTGAFSFHANLFSLEKGTPKDELKKTMIEGDTVETLSTTLPEQLGLKLEAQKAPVEILVIDRAEKIPTGN